MLNSIQAKMIVVISVLVIVLVGASSSILYERASSIMQRSIFDSSVNSADQNAEIISKWIKSITGQVDALSHTDEIKSMAWDRQRNVLYNIMNAEENIDMLFVADLAGDFYATNGNQGNIAGRNYFKEVIRTKELFTSKPLQVIDDSNQLSIIIVSPIMKNEEMVGIVGASVGLEYLQELASDMKINGHGYGWIIDNEMTTIAHPNEDYLGDEDVFKEADGLKKIAESMIQGESGIASYEFNGVEKQLAYSPIKINDWSIAMTAETDDVLREINSIKNVSLIIGIVGIVIGILVTYFIANFISKPINDATKHAETIASGDFTIDLPEKYLSRKDEIGRLIQAFAEMTSKLRTMITKVKGLSDQVAASSEELSASGDQVGEAAQEVSSAIQGVASGVEEQSAQVDETLNYISSLIQQINDVGENTIIMNKSADNVMNSIETGNDLLNDSIAKVNSVKEDSIQVADTINLLGDLSEQIGDIIDLIDGISAQTNLLALNAAIEAARAGKAGQGFSVVADEIRELAVESTDATKEIDELIKEIQGSVRKLVSRMKESEVVVDESVNTIKATGQSFAEINDASSKLIKLINDISNKTQEMSVNSKEVNKAVEQIASVSQEAAGNAEEVAASSEEQSAATEEIITATNELAKMAQSLSDSLGEFKI